MTDVNDNSPTCLARADDIVQVEGNTATGSIVTTVMAFDPDSNDRLIFRLSDNFLSESRFFRINETSGEIFTSR